MIIFQLQSKKANSTVDNVSHLQTLFFTDRDLEESLQARIASEETNLSRSSPVVYIENHDPVTEVNAEII